MKQFKTVFAHELATQLKNKAFIVVTAILVIGIVGLMLFTRFKNSGVEDNSEGAIKIGITVEKGIDEAQAKDALSNESRFQAREIVVEKDVESLKEAVKSGKYESGFVLHDAGHYTYYVNNLSIFDDTTQTFENVMKKLNLRTALKQNGISNTDFRNESCK